MKGRLWTEDEIATLRTMISRKATIEQICAALGRSKDSVVAKAPQLGLTALQNFRAGARSIKVRRVSVPKKPASITAHLMGDPPPGRSALDMRGQG